MPGFDQSGALAAANARDDIKQRRKDRNLARNQAIAQLIIQGVQAVGNLALGGVGAYQGGVRNDLLQKRVEGEQELGLKSLDQKASQFATSEERAGNEFGLTQEARRQEHEDTLGLNRDELTSRERLAGLTQEEETRRAALKQLLDATAKDGGGITPEMRAVAEAYGLPIPAAPSAPPASAPATAAPPANFWRGARALGRGALSAGRSVEDFFRDPDAAAPAAPPAPPPTPNLPTRQIEGFFRPTPGGLSPREGGFSPLRLRPEPTGPSMTPRPPPAGWYPMQEEVDSKPAQETSGLSSPALRAMVLQQMLAEESSPSIPGISGPPEEEKRIKYPDNSGASARRRRAFAALSRG